MPPHRFTTDGTVGQVMPTSPSPHVGNRVQSHRTHVRSTALSVFCLVTAMFTSACNNTNKPSAELDPHGQPIVDLAGGVKVDAAAADSVAAELPPVQPGTAVMYDTVGESVTRAASITPAMIRRGRELFHGRGPGASSCSNCHGQNGGGALTGPELRSGNFGNITGTYNSIVRLVTVGVAEPKRFVGMVMPPMGGVQMSEEDIRAVSAYVYSLVPEARRQVD